MVILVNDVEHGPVARELDDAKVGEFLLFLINTNHWKANPELLHDKALLLRKRLLETSEVLVEKPKKTKAA